jgi:anaerobic selenocysteine-containing dehydrogenase
MAVSARVVKSDQAVRTYCGLCKITCPAVVSLDGLQVLSLEPDRAHPLGGAVCGKGRAAPEMHDHPHRVNYPLRRTRPKSDDDPGWERCSWDEALDLIARRLREVRESSGPQAVAFGRGTSSATGFREAEPWFVRLANYFGSPNYMTTAHVCNWARDGAALYTFGVGSLPLPDAERSGCIVLWGVNPSATGLSLARAVIAAKERGARLVVVDPRRVGLANKSDLLLQPRPGTDGALALAFIDRLIERGWFDQAFVREWTNAPLLVREDNGRLLTAAEVAAGRLAADGLSAEPTSYLALEQASGRVVEYRPASRRYTASPSGLALSGATTVELVDGRQVRCRPVFELLAETARVCSAEVAAEISGVPAERIREAVRLIAENRPVSHYLYNGLVQHTNGTQTCRAIEIFYALLGDFDRAGGNLIPASAGLADVAANGVLPAEQAAQRLGRAERPLGPPAAAASVAGFDLYTAILEQQPYPVRALLAFGGNLLLANADSKRGCQALERLEFFAQAELFHTPTSRYADVLLPAAGFLESEALAIGGTVRRRPRVVEPLYERRPDLEIVFDLAQRLGFGEQFGNGEVRAEYDRVLAPLGLDWEALRDRPEGVRAAPANREAKYAGTRADGGLVGFGTPSGQVELFSGQFAAHGYEPLPVYQEPAESPVRTPELAAEYPLVLTNAKRPQYLQSQHRAVATIRRTAADPTIEIHPQTAAEYGLIGGAWALVETPRGRARARVEVTRSIVPGVVCGNHGWWEGCEALGLPEHDVRDERGGNFNLLVHADLRDPISGGTPHRSSLCRVRMLSDG